MMVASVAEALARIPQDKVQLDAEDDVLRDTIRHVEHALNELQPGVSCETHEGKSRLEFTSANRRWIIVWKGEHEDIPLLSASRDVRAAVFQPGRDGLSLLECLVIKVANSLVTAKAARSPMLEAARRLTVALTEAGYPPPR